MNLIRDNSAILNELILYLQRILNFQLVSSVHGKAQNEIISTLIKNSSRAWESAKDKEVDSFFILMLKVINSQPESESFDLKVQMFDSLMFNAATRPQSQLMLLNILYNNFDDVNWKVKVFVGILKVAWKNQLLPIVKSQLLQLNRLFLEWNLDESRYHDIYYYASKFFPDSWAQYSIKWLLTFDDAGIQSHFKKINSLIIKLINKDNVMLFDKIYQSAVVKALDPRLSELLRLLLMGTLKDFETYSLENRAFMESNNINIDGLTSKFCILTLISSVSRQKDYTYEDIANSLEIEKDLVEYWIISAIGKGVLGAKLDQANEIVHVSHVVERQITESSWIFIKSQLDLWKESLQSIIKITQCTPNNQAKDTTTQPSKQ